MSGRETPLPERLGSHELLEKLPAPDGNERYLAASGASFRELTIVRADLQRRALAQRELTRTMRAIGSVVGQHVVHAFGVEAQGDLTYVVTEHVMGKSLPYVIEDIGSINPSIAMRILLDVAQGLRTLHNASPHGDVRPAHILLCEDGNVRLGGLGIGGAMEFISLTPKAAQMRLAYRPPEELRGWPPTPAGDLYSFGVLSHELFTGTSPFPGGSVDSLLVEVNQPVFASTLRMRGVPESMCGLVLNLLSASAAARPPDAATLLEMLTEIAKVIPPASREEIAALARRASSHSDAPALTGDSMEGALARAAEPAPEPADIETAEHEADVEDEPEDEPVRISLPPRPADEVMRRLQETPPPDAPSDRDGSGARRLSAVFDDAEAAQVSQPTDESPLQDPAVAAASDEISAEDAIVAEYPGADEGADVDAKKAADGDGESDDETNRKEGEKRGDDDRAKRDEERPNDTEEPAAFGEPSADLALEGAEPEGEDEPESGEDPGPRVVPIPVQGSEPEDLTVPEDYVPVKPKRISIPMILVGNTVLWLVISVFLVIQKPSAGPRHRDAGAAHEDAGELVQDPAADSLQASEHSPAVDAPVADVEGTEPVHNEVERTEPVNNEAEHRQPVHDDPLPDPAERPTGPPPLTTAIGTLEVTCQRACQVVVDGVAASSPGPVQIEGGLHSVVVQDAQSGAEQVLRVFVPPGGSVERRVAFAQR